MVNNSTNINKINESVTVIVNSSYNINNTTESWTLIAHSSTNIHKRKFKGDRQQFH